MGLHTRTQPPIITGTGTGASAVCLCFCLCLCLSRVSLSLSPARARARKHTHTLVLNVASLSDAMLPCRRSLWPMTTYSHPTDLICRA